MNGLLLQPNGTAGGTPPSAQQGPPPPPLNLGICCCRDSRGSYNVPATEETISAPPRGCCCGSERACCGRSLIGDICEGNVYCSICIMLAALVLTLIVIFGSMAWCSRFRRRRRERLRRQVELRGQLRAELASQGEGTDPEGSNVTGDGAGGYLICFAAVIGQHSL